MYRILVVDDTPDFRHVLEGVLSDEGHIVQDAANEGEALDAVFQESFDFACIDVRLHGEGEDDESGLSLVMALRAIDPKIRVILLTRYVRAKQIVRAIRYLGVVDFVDKSTQNWDRRLLDILAETEENQKDPKQIRMKTMGDTTTLSLSLAPKRPLMIRARGTHVCSRDTSKTLGINLDRYARKTKLARQSLKDLRFQVSEIGHELWREIFTDHPEAVRTYLEARAKSQSLSLLFESPREFLQLPLEFTRSDEPDEYLILQHPLSRFVCGATPKREALSPQMLARTSQLRILLIASNTEPSIDGVDIETQKLHDYLHSQDRIPAEVTFLPTERATYDRVRTELKGVNYDIIHYAGHGYHKSDSPEASSLYFWSEENKQGDILPMKAAELEMLLARSEVRLVYLSSCYGAATGGKATLLDDDFLGLADAVAQAGVPSVLGFRWPVSDEGACEMALAFYRSLLDQGKPEIALWSARREIAAPDRNDTTWMSPILIHQK
jgi:CheY-like chemotaxis protein